MLTRILHLPGIGNSGPLHWQSQWETAHAGSDSIQITRIEQDEWDAPECSRWVQSLETQVQKIGRGAILVAHSAACLMVATWACKSALATSLKGILLVAVPDPDADSFPKQATGFSSMALQKLPVRAIQLSSTNDPYSSPEFSERFSNLTGTEHHNLGALGHINSDSGLGNWPSGWRYVESLTAE